MGDLLVTDIWNANYDYRFVKGASKNSYLRTLLNVLSQMLGLMSWLLQHTFI